jgi:addiction module antitoxin, relB/dinJ family
MANLTVRVDDDLKRQAEEVLADSGLTMTTAINAFLTEVVRSNGIPFALQADPFFSAENQRRLRIAKERMEQKGGTVRSPD